MNTKDNTILITGGATGIGRSLAETFMSAGNEVIICGRRENRLNEVKTQWPQVHIRVCDVSKEKERESLYNWTRDNFKDINILINNAGIQIPIDLRKGVEALLDDESEIETNLVAPISLSVHFIPLLMEQEAAAIVNVSSGLAFVPTPFVPIYCATKAALHSFTVSLRYQLEKTSVKVFEVVPPAVVTELHWRRTEGRSGRGSNAIQPSEVAEATLKGLANDEYEIYPGWVKDFIERGRTGP
ncbi:MAG TPA: SDR family NAD(P)-dependent oxidoreductase [Dehalococcoidia bacterium]|nr:SDR family NAD(P)-dependent oxidoreductase [Dehalococcoidia bacterium]